MSEEDIKDAELVSKIRKWMIYPVIFLNALLDKLLLSILIFVIFMLVLVSAGLGFQLYHGTAISASLDLIPLTRQ